MSDLREVMARKQMAVEYFSPADMLAELATLRTRVETAEREKQAAERRVEEMRKGLEAACPEDGIDIEDKHGPDRCAWCGGVYSIFAEEVKHADSCGWKLGRAALLAQPTAAGRTDGIDAIAEAIAEDLNALTGEDREVRIDKFNRIVSRVRGREAGRTDGERLDWLATHTEAKIEAPWGMDHQHWAITTDDDYYGEGESLRAAIDAAMEPPAKSATPEGK